MTLTEIALHQFRSYTEARFSFSPRVTIISGPNGSGKTNILEAIYALCSGRSFRDGDGDLTQFDAPWWRVEGMFGDTRRDVRYDPSKLPSKQLVMDGVKKSRVTYREQLPVVLFEPEDLRLIDGSPSRRREFIDRILVQLSPAYRRSLRTYERALVQRNNLLKQTGRDVEDTLFVWDVALAEHGARLVEERRRFVDETNLRLSDIYSRIADTSHIVTMRYLTHTAAKDTRSSLLSQLKRSLPTDRLRGYTTVGPHRDDIDFQIGGKAAATTASRGEVRSIILSLKLIEAELYAAHYEDTPILLFDDVFSELDETRRTKLLEVQADMQLILTTTDADIASGYKATHIILGR